MSKIFKYCFRQDSTDSETYFGKMDANFCNNETDFGRDAFGKTEQYNGIPCPFSGASELKINGQKTAKPNLRLKVPQPMKLKNHLVSEENFDSLHSRLEEVTSFVSNKFCLCLFLL